MSHIEKLLNKTFTDYPGTGIFLFFRRYNLQTGICKFGLNNTTLAAKVWDTSGFK